MKKLVAITLFAVAVPISASFATGQIEFRATTPTYVAPSQQTYDQQAYDQRRDQQWALAQQNQERQRVLAEQQARYNWQRDHWQMEQRSRRARRLSMQSYEEWLAMHRFDYDNRYLVVTISHDGRR